MDDAEEQQRIELAKELSQYSEEVREYFPEPFREEFDQLSKQRPRATSSDLKDFRRRLKKATTGIEPPPPIEVHIQKEYSEDGKECELVASWIPPMWPVSLQYTGEYGISAWEGHTPVQLVHPIEKMRKCSIKLQGISPIHCYYAKVWCVNGKGQRSRTVTTPRKEKCCLYRSLNEQVYINDCKAVAERCTVYKGQLKNANLDNVAVKIVSGPDTPVVINCSDPNIVTYYASGKVIGGIDQCFVAMEYCRSETFAELISRRQLDDTECKRAFLHIMHALYEIHKEKLFHGNLNPHNILRSSDGEKFKIPCLRICDKAKANKSSSQSHVKDGWWSPEHYGIGDVSEMSDIFCSGLIFAFGLSHGKHICGEKNYEWITQIITGKLKTPKSILRCKDQRIAEDIILKMLKKNPGDRVTAEYVLKHPYFWDHLRKLQFFQELSPFFRQFIKEGRIIACGATRKVLCRLQTEFQKKNWYNMMEKSNKPKEDRSVLKYANNEVEGTWMEYCHTSVFDLITFIRNMEIHFRQDTEVKKKFGNSKENVWNYFSETFPDLLCMVWNAIRDSLSDIIKGDKFPPELKRFFSYIAPR